MILNNNNIIYSKIFIAKLRFLMRIQLGPDYNMRPLQYRVGSIKFDHLYY
jgi:hypothetical protein